MFESFLIKFTGICTIFFYYIKVCGSFNGTAKLPLNKFTKVKPVIFNTNFSKKQKQITNQTFSILFTLLKTNKARENHYFEL